MLKFLAFTLAAFTLLPWADCATATEPTKAKILLIYTRPDHPRGTHMYEIECKLLAKCLEQTPGVQTEIVEEWPSDPKAFEGVKAIAFYSRPAGDIVLAPQRRDQFRKLMKDGVGLACIHWSTGSTERLAPEWLGFLGAWFHRPPCEVKVAKSPLTLLDPEHPICRGWAGQELNEEYYLDLRFHEDAQPLVVAEVDKRDQIVAWALERKESNGGRSFGTTLGHFHENFASEPIRKAFVNGILWAAHVEVPEDGAPVAASEKDLELPHD